jgi:hypothetical protein
MKTTSNLPQAGSFAVTVISIIVALTLLPPPLNTQSMLQLKDEKNPKENKKNY